MSSKYKAVKRKSDDQRLYHPMPATTKKAAELVLVFLFCLSAMVVVAGIGSVITRAVMA